MTKTYAVTLPDFLACVLSDPQNAAAILLDAADAQTHLGGTGEAIEESMKSLFRSHVANGLAALQGKMGAVHVTCEGDPPAGVNVVPTATGGTP